MELIEAVKKQDVQKVEVRRQLEAISITEYGPSRGVCLGLGRWTLDAVVARPIRPCWVESSPYVRHQSGNCDAACRRSSVPVRTSSSVTCTLPCRLAESHNFSPPPSPAIAVPATFLSLPRLMDARAGCEMATTPSPREYSLSLTATQNRTYSRPSGRACCFVFRVPVGYWGTPVGPTPAARPRRAQRWQHRAALGGEIRQSPNRPIARRCRRRRARPGRLRVRRLRSRRIGR
jgi:hypothetical protein